MKTKITLLLAATTLLIAAPNRASAQGTAINTTGAAAAASAMLDVTSTTKGVLVPRMTTTQRNAISSPATGLMVYDNTLNSYYYYNGSAWTAVGGGAPSGSAGGDLSGTYPSPTLANSGVTAGTYGSTTLSPQITVDAKGRITGVSNQTIAGGGGFVTGSYVNPQQTTPFYVGYVSGGGSGSSSIGDVMPVACTIDAFYARVTVTATYISGGNNTYVGTIIKNGIATGSTVTFALGTGDASGALIGTFSDVAHTVSVSAGDVISVRWTQSNPGATSSTGGELAAMNCSYHAH